MSDSRPSKERVDLAYDTWWRQMTRRGDPARRAHLSEEAFRAGWEARAACDSQPCRSPYCECAPGQCTHPGFYDARAVVEPSSNDLLADAHAIHCAAEVGMPCDCSVPARISAIVDAASAVIARWETPLWKDAPATAVYINALRNALEGRATVEPETGLEKARDVVASVVKSLGGEARIGATLALNAIAEAMIGTPASEPPKADIEALVESLVWAVRRDNDNGDQYTRQEVKDLRAELLAAIRATVPPVARQENAQLSKALEIAESAAKTWGGPHAPSAETNALITLLEHVRHAEPPSPEHPDKERLDWLNEQPVHFIELDDFSIIDVKGLDVRAAIDAKRHALTKSESPQHPGGGILCPECLEDEHAPTCSRLGASP